MKSAAFQHIIEVVVDGVTISPGTVEITTQDERRRTLSCNVGQTEEESSVGKYLTTVPVVMCAQKTTVVQT